MDIKAKSKELAEPIIVQFDVAEDLKGLVAQYGEETVHELAVAEICRAIRNLALVNKAKPLAEIQGFVDAWQPGVRRARTTKTPLERASAALGQMSAEDLAALLEKVKAAKKAA